MCVCVYWKTSLLHFLFFFFKDNFTEYGILSWQVFFSSAHKRFYSTVFWLAWFLMWNLHKFLSLSLVMCLPPPHPLPTLPLVDFIIDLKQFDYGVPCCGFLCIYLAWGVWSFSDHYVYDFHQIWKTVSHHIFKWRVLGFALAGIWVTCRITWSS